MYKKTKISKNTKIPENTVNQENTEKCEKLGKFKNGEILKMVTFFLNMEKKCPKIQLKSPIGQPPVQFKLLLTGGRLNIMLYIVTLVWWCKFVIDCTTNQIYSTTPSSLSDSLSRHQANLESDFFVSARGSPCLGHKILEKKKYLYLFIFF